MVTRLLSVIIAVVFLSLPIGSNDQDTIAIISLNDFHGAFVENTKQKIPGAGNLYSNIKRIQERYPYNVVVSAGDNFGGSFFSNMTQGELIPFFFKHIGVSISAIGNHEFDNGQPFLRDKWRAIAGKDTLTYVCANLLDASCTPNKIPSYAQPYVIKKVMMPDGTEQELGIIGLVASSAGSQTKSQNVTGLKFSSNYAEIVNNLETKADLKGVEWQILLTHIGTAMRNNTPVWEDADSANLVGMPSKIIGIASGHSHKKVCGRVGNVPIVQGEISGKYIGVLRFIYDRNTKKITPIDPYLAEVKPIVDTSPTRKNIDRKIDSIYRSAVEPTTKKTLSTKLTTVVSKGGLPHDRNNSKNFTALGTYVCMAYASAFYKSNRMDITEQIVIAFSQFGGIRTSLPEGDIDLMTAGEVLPFSNKLKMYRLSGREIFNIIEAGLKNKKGYLQTNNLKIDTIHVAGEVKVINVRFFVPDRLELFLSQKDIYFVFVDEYITTGGDGYSTSLFPKNREFDMKTREYYTTPALLQFLQETPYLDNDTPYKATLQPMY